MEKHLSKEDERELRRQHAELGSNPQKAAWIALFGDNIWPLVSGALPYEEIQKISGEALTSN